MKKGNVIFIFLVVCSIILISVITSLLTNNLKKEVIHIDNRPVIIQNTYLNKTENIIKGDLSMICVKNQIDEQILCYEEKK